MPEVRSHRFDKELERDSYFEFFVDGKLVPAREGETVATAMIAAGLLTARITASTEERRGYYCGMGICWESTSWSLEDGERPYLHDPRTPRLSASGNAGGCRRRWSGP